MSATDSKGGGAWRPIQAELDGLVGGLVVGAEVCSASGLVSLAVRVGGALRVLGVGVGPSVVGLGFLPGRPRGTLRRTHPLVAALRAHVVGGELCAVDIDERGVVGLLVDKRDGEGAAPARRARVTCRPGRAGEVRIDAGVTVRWPARREDAERAVPLSHDLHAVGAKMLAESDALVVSAERTALRRALARRRAAVARRSEAVRADLSRLGDAEALERSGRLLSAQATRIPRGAKRAELDDWECGGKLTIELDPKRTARAQVETLFAGARRARRGKPLALRRLEAAAKELEALDALAAELSALPADAPIASLTERAAALGAKAGGALPSAGGRRVAGGEERVPFHVFSAAGARRVLVGRGAADNDELTTRHARPHDLWLHAKGRTGAHVVVPLEKNESCPSELLVDAATLAAHFSDARGEPICEVSYAPRRYVRKRKGSPPGTVALDREKVMTLRLEPARLARLLASGKD